MRRLLILIVPCLLLAACGPRLKAEAIAGRTIMITNQEKEPLTVQRIVANGANGRAECVDSPGALLGPGRTYTTTFFYCDAVEKVSVETDAGTATVSIDS